MADKYKHYDFTFFSMINITTEQNFTIIMKTFKSRLIIKEVDRRSSSHF